MTHKAATCLTLFAILMMVWSCQNMESLSRGEAVLRLPAIPYTYDTTDTTKTTNNFIPTLGRVLFYDSRLSVNNAVSCATCHKQARAFADNVALSAGFEGKRTFRNSMPIQNLGVQPFFGGFNGDLTINEPDVFISDTLSMFWDGREKVLKTMVLRPITNHVEMGITDLQALAVKLGQIPDYQKLFIDAYGTAAIDQFKIGEALSQFLLSITSNATRFDQQRTTFTAQETIGFNLFENKYDCNSCHRVDALNGYQLGGGFVNIGLDETYTDIGQADITGNQRDVGKFKIPTLRNVALTAPYMHDGRFTTLDDVMEHYSSGIADHPNLDHRLRTGGTGEPVRMNISVADRQAIIAFLSTLTDNSMITDPRFSNPFVIQ